MRGCRAAALTALISGLALPARAQLAEGRSAPPRPGRPVYQLNGPGPVMVVLQGATPMALRPSGRGTVSTPAPWPSHLSQPPRGIPIVPVTRGDGRRAWLNPFSREAQTAASP